MIQNVSNNTDKIYLRLAEFYISEHAIDRLSFRYAIKSKIMLSKIITTLVDKIIANNTDDFILVKKDITDNYSNKAKNDLYSYEIDGIIFYFIMDKEKKIRTFLTENQALRTYNG